MANAVGGAATPKTSAASGTASRMDVTPPDLKKKRSTVSELVDGFERTIISLEF